jgi:hypothetical protein
VIVPRDVDEPYTAEMRKALEAAYPTGAKLLTAFRLARDVDTCSDLLVGVPVDQSRLDQDVLVAARRHSLVALHAPIELVNVQEAA